MNAKEIYKHYCISMPQSKINPELVYDALDEIAKNARVRYYARALKKYLFEKNVSIEDFIAEDEYEKMAIYNKISPSDRLVKRKFKKVCLAICHDQHVTRLAWGACTIPDLESRYDPYNVNLIENSLAEAKLGILPYSLLNFREREAIERVLQIPYKMIMPVKKFLNYYRTHKIERRHIEMDTTNLVCIWAALRSLILGTSAKSWSEFNGETGAHRIKEFLEMSRTYTTSKSKHYRIRIDSPLIWHLKIFFNCMWRALGIKCNPYSVPDPNEVNPESKVKLLDKLNLPYGVSEFKGSKLINDQVKIGITDGNNKMEYISPCFSYEEMKLIFKYIKIKTASIISGKEKNFRALRIKDLKEYMLDLQGDLLLAFSIMNGPRSVDCFAMSVEDVGEFSTNLKDVANERFYTSLPTIENNVRLSPNKVRPAKRFFGDIFTIFVQLMKVRGELLKKKSIVIPKSKYSNMINEGTPMFINILYQRAQPASINDFYRKTLKKIGLRASICDKATLYWARKSFVTTANLLDIPIRNVSQIVGTCPETLWEKYVQLDMTNDTEDNYVHKYLDTFGMVPEKYQGNQLNKIAPDLLPANKANCAALDDNDRCTMQKAQDILGMTKMRLIRMLKDHLIKGIKENNRWLFSMESIRGFKNNKLDVEQVREALSKSERNLISRRRTIQLMQTILKDNTIMIGNKLYAEANPVYRLAQKRKGADISISEVN